MEHQRRNGEISLWVKYGHLYFTAATNVLYSHMCCSLTLLAYSNTLIKTLSLYSPPTLSHSLAISLFLSSSLFLSHSLSVYSSYYIVLSAPLCVPSFSFSYSLCSNPFSLTHTSTSRL